MTSNQSEMRELHPAVPDEAVGDLLELSSAQIFQLSSGGSCTGYGVDGDYWLVTATGSVTVSYSDDYRVLYPQQVLALHWRGAFTVHSVGESICTLVKLRGELPERLLGSRLQDGVALFTHGMSAVRGAVNALSVVEDETPPADGNAASAYAYAMLMSLLSGQVLDVEENKVAPLSQLVAAAIEIIQEEFLTLEGLDALARRLQVSKAHLIRKFTKETGISPGKYIIRVRVEYAKLLLRGEGNSIAYVAEAAGFANANYFAKVFRRELGMSPSEYIGSSPRRSRQNEP